VPSLYVPKSIVCLRDYSWEKFRSDALAGVIVGLVALPLSMAFAIAAGLPPSTGLVTAVVAGFLASALGGSRVSISGPTGAFVIILAGIVHQYGYRGLAVATLMAGIFLVAMGFLQLGSVVKFIPFPVTTGFTSGIAVVIFSTQVRDLLGLQMQSVPSEFVEKWEAYIGALPTFSPYALGLSVGTLLVLVLWPKTWRVPGPVVVLVGGTLLAYLMQWPVETVESRFGPVPSGIPMPSFEGASWAEIRGLFPAALTIAFLAAIESLLCAVVSDGMIGGRHKSNLELIAQGAANIASPFFGGIPATGAIARTATNVKNGGRTPVAGMVHAAVLLVILLVAAPLAGRVPLAVLGGILVLVAYNMSEWRSFRFIHTGPRSDIIVLWATFLLTVFVDLTVAVGAGMGMAMALFMRKMAELTQVRALHHERDEALFNGDIPKDVEVYAIAGSFFFGAASKVMEIDRQLSKKPRALILEMRGVLHMDATGMNVVRSIHRQCKAKGIRVIIAGIHAQPMVVMQQSGAYEVMGEENFVGDLKDALKALEDHNPSADPVG